MNKAARQYVGLVLAIFVYYIIHEGAHLLYALMIGVFKQINLIGLGVQVDVFAENMTDTQMGLFCVAGSVATILLAYVLVAFANKIGKVSSKVFKASMYYITIAMLVIDPLYLSVLCGFVGGGDMNGISRLVPEAAARIMYGAILVINMIVFARFVLPEYKLAFSEAKDEMK